MRQEEERLAAAAAEAAARPAGAGGGAAGAAERAAVALEKLWLRLCARERYTLLVALAAPAGLRPAHVPPALLRARPAAPVLPCTLQRFASRGTLQRFASWGTLQ